MFVSHDVNFNKDRQSLVILGDRRQNFRFVTCNAIERETVTFRMIFVSLQNEVTQLTCMPPTLYMYAYDFKIKMCPKNKNRHSEHHDNGPSLFKCHG